VEKALIGWDCVQSAAALESAHSCWGFQSGAHCSVPRSKYQQLNSHSDDSHVKHVFPYLLRQYVKPTILMKQTSQSDLSPTPHAQQCHHLLIGKQPWYTSSSHKGSTTAGMSCQQQKHTNDAII
jgi:hypothetical protein